MEFGRIFVGTDDGNLHVTFDSGKTWELITDGLKEERWISRVIASRWTDGVVYAAQNGKRWDDLDAYLERCNTKRPHQGYNMLGRTPYKAFLDALEKSNKTEKKEVKKAA